MRRPGDRLASLALGVFLLAAGVAEAVITRLTPLKEVLATEQYIFTVEVEKVDPDKPALVLQVRDDLKGKAPFRRLPVNLTGDSEGQKEKHTPQLLKRVAPKVMLVVFASQRGKRYTAFGYTNGTWFQMLGQAGDDPAAVTWGFTHCEPYLRRTFKGTTSQLRKAVVDGLEDRKAPPEPDPKEPPGLGPELPAGDKPPSGTGGPPFAVIPTFVLVGPLALLASIFGFGGLALLLRRWLVLLSVACTLSTLYLAHAWFRGSLKDSWWGSQTALWVAAAVVTLLGAAWSWRRYRAAVRAGRGETLQPRRGERFVLGLLSMTGLAVVCWTLAQGVLLVSPWRELLPVWVVAWTGSLCLVRWRQGNPRPTEGIMLGALVCACLGLGAMSLPQPTPPTGAVAVLWTFEAKDRGTLASSPLVVGDRVYIGAAHSSGFTSYGALYCLDRNTRELLWTFTDDDGMKQVFSTPCVAEGRLYVGEGFHQDSACKLYCLDAATGKKLWEFATASHTESSPCVVDGRVFFGAGDDGVYCLDAGTGKELWHFPGLHVDTPPAVAGNRVYGGSGYGSHEVFCLAADTGRVVWRLPVDLPAFAAPVVAETQVFFGLGNGDFLKSADRPAGALLCVDAETGRRLWRHDAADAVHGRPVATDQRVYCCSRDRHCYCLDRKDGRIVWQADVGSPVVASPALVGKWLYVAPSAGAVACLDADSGGVRWTFDLAGHAQTKVQVLSSPAVVPESDGCRLYVGAGLDNVVSSAAGLYCLGERQ
jgi:outer membrane protein assembly factor BamB